MLKAMETKSGQVFEIYTNVKEVLHNVVDNYRENIGSDLDGNFLYILYKDGTEYLITDGLEEGTFKHTGIQTVIESNSSTCSVYGKYRIYNTDRIEETYCIDTDNEEKYWDVEAIA